MPAKVQPKTTSSNAENAKALEYRLIAGFLVLALLSLAVLALSHPVVDQDIWHEIALARLLFETGELPIADPFAYTPTVSFIQHEWGAGVIALLALESFGAPGLAILKFTLGALLALFVALRLRLSPPSVVVLVPVVLLALNMLQPGFGTVRAQIYSLVAVAILLWFLALDREGNRRWIWAWLPIFVVWLNVHGGFVVGFGVLGAEWLERAAKGRRDWHLVGVGAAMLGAVAINPYGFQYCAYMIEALTIRRPDIKEWQPIWIAAADFPASVVSLALSTIVLAYAIRNRGWREASGVGVLLLLLIASVRTNRLTMFYGLAFLTTAPAMLQGSRAANWAERTLRRWSGAAFPITAIIALLLTGAAWMKQPWRVVVPGSRIPSLGKHVVYPVGAIDYLKQNGFRGNLMVSFPIGAYVMWKLYPEAKISMDSRYEVAYHPSFAERFIQLYQTGEGAGEVLGAYAHDALLVEVASPLHGIVSANENWRLGYSDASYSVFLPQTSPLPEQIASAASPDGEIP